MTTENGEVDDVRAALDWLDHEFHLPLIFAGFSFGAAVGLRAACPDTRVKAADRSGRCRWRRLMIAPTTSAFLQTCVKPKLFVSGDRDQFGPPRN